jgi:pimeloyl-ACP methyl ester carboxylesterase
MVAGMKNGSVIVDLAAEAGGNVEGTVKDQATITANGVTILGWHNWPARIPAAASALYARNLLTFLTTFWDKDGKAPKLPSMAAAEMLVRAVSAPFGPHTDAEWRFLTEHVVKSEPDGSVAFRYDPAIEVAFNAEKPHRDLDLWPVYDAVKCPTLVLRGAASDLLTPACATSMTGRGPRALLHEFAGVGHAPTLIHDDQIAVVRNFLG